MTSRTLAEPTAATRQHLVSVAGLPEFWAVKTGADVTSETTMVWNGGSLQPEVLASPATTANIIVRRPYKPLRDGPIKRALRSKIGRWRTTVSDQDTDADLVPVGRPDVYPQALLVAMRVPEANAESGDPGQIELEFAVSGAAR